MANCSACVPTTGFTRNCNSNTPGGNDTAVYLTAACNVTGFTDSYSDGVVDDITLEASTFFLSVTAERQSVEVNQTYNEDNSSINQEVIFRISNFSNNSDRDIAAQEAADFVNSVNNTEGYLLLVKDRAGVMRIYGKSDDQPTGLYLTNIENNSGAAPGDVSGTVLTFSDATTQMADVLSSDYSIPTS